MLVFEKKKFLVAFQLLTGIMKKIIIFRFKIFNSLIVDLIISLLIITIHIKQLKIQA